MVPWTHARVSLLSASRSVQRCSRSKLETGSRDQRLNIHTTEATQTGQNCLETFLTCRGPNFPSTAASSRREFNLRVWREEKAASLRRRRRRCKSGIMRCRVCVLVRRLHASKASTFLFRSGQRSHIYCCFQYTHNACVSATADHRFGTRNLNTSDARAFPSSNFREKKNIKYCVNTSRRACEKYNSSRASFDVDYHLV